MAMMPPGSTALPSSNAVLPQSRPTNAPLTASLTIKGVLLSLIDISRALNRTEGIVLRALVC